MRTDVARQFLATDARAGWDPLRKVITYEGRGSTTGSSEVKVDLLGAHWIDGRGTWRGQRGKGDLRLGFPIVQEGDAFRIASARVTGPKCSARPSCISASMAMTLSHMVP